MAGAQDELDQMVERQLAARDIRDPRVLAAFRKIDRAFFVPSGRKGDAYEDHPLPIGEGQTISQPYMVALMTQGLDLTGAERVLEIGTGSGYQAAILAELAAELYTIEVHEGLQTAARRRLDVLAFDNVHYRVGDGRQGWPEESPFDRILCAAAAEEMPGAWLEQLGDPGVLVAPVGGFGTQVLERVERRGGRTSRTQFCPCRFVPLVDRGEPGRSEA